MISAQQAAQVDVLDTLLGTRERLLNIRSSIALDPPAREKLQKIVADIDDLFQKQFNEKTS